MGVAGRKRKHEERMKKKRAAKAAKREKYKALAGTSRKRKRQSANTKGATAYKHAHIMSNCGNVGCKRCHPQFAA